MATTKRQLFFVDTRDCSSLDGSVLFGLDRMSWQLPLGQFGCIQLSTNHRFHLVYSQDALLFLCPESKVAGFKWHDDVAGSGENLKVSLLMFEDDHSMHLDDKSLFSQTTDLEWLRWTSCIRPEWLLKASSMGLVSVDADQDGEALLRKLLFEIPFDSPFMDNILDKSALIDRLGGDALLEGLQVSFLLFRLFNSSKALDWWLAALQLACCSERHSRANSQFVTRLFESLLYRINDGDIGGHLMEIPPEFFLDKNSGVGLNVVQRWLAMICSDAQEVIHSEVSEFKKLVSRHLKWSLEEEDLIPEDEQPLIVG